MGEIREVVELSSSKKRVTVTLKDGREITGGWFTDGAPEKVQGKVNATVGEEREVARILGENGLSESDMQGWHISRLRKEGNVYITDHAMERMRGRCGWNRKTAMRMVGKVVESGTPAEEAKGWLKPYLRHVASKQDENYWNVIFGGHLFVFRHESLITVMCLPNKAAAGKIARHAA